MGIKKNKPKSTVKENPQISLTDLDQHIWPVERNVFFRPARLKYVRKLVKPKGCVFCQSAQAEMSVKTLCVYKTKYSQVVVNKFPYNSGHLLVLPLNHGGHLLELSDEQFFDLNETVRKSVRALQDLYSPQGFNIGLNHGATGGAGIPDHLHYHIVPRWNGDLNFFPLIADTKLVIETAEQTYKKLKTYFNKKKQGKNK